MTFNVLCATTKQCLSKNCVGFPTVFGITRNVLSSRCSQTNLRQFLSSKSSPTKIPKAASKKPFPPKDDYITIYRLPSISAISFIGKLKRRQIIVQSIATPVVLALSYAGIISSEVSLIICLTGLALCFKFYILGFLTTNLVGIVYASPDLSTVKLSYIDSWGRRQDDVIPTDDLIPLSDLSPKWYETWFRHIYRVSQTKPLYKLNLSHGKITDVDKFNYIFGKVD